MQNIHVGEKYKIQCYKHNRKVHRSWDEAVILDIKEDYIVCGNNKTTVIESSGNWWKTKEPAIMYFFYKEWFNVIAQIKNDGIYYYCNIATPFIIEEGTIKYIDYDLDLRVFPNGEFKILDRLEYDYHRKMMGYNEELDKTINRALDDLIENYLKGIEIFNFNKNKHYCSNYMKLIKTSNLIENK